MQVHAAYDLQKKGYINNSSNTRIHHYAFKSFSAYCSNGVGNFNSIAFALKLQLLCASAHGLVVYSLSTSQPFAAPSFNVLVCRFLSALVRIHSCSQSWKYSLVA